MLKDILHFLLFTNSVKLYHFSTQSYAGHKASDELYTSLIDLLDKFWEVYQGKYSKLHLDGKEKKIKVTMDLITEENLIEEIYKFEVYLKRSTIIKKLEKNNDTDLLNIRDEILGNLHQFKYLTTFH
jgi:hypothetical protein